jgi:hypothetical protein
MKKEGWEEYKRRSRTWGVRVGYDLLHSEAFRNLRYAPAIKVLFWFHEKIRMRKIHGRKRGMQRYERINTEITFTYNEARLRGLTDQQFSRALKELHARGFIDIVKPGSGLMGDNTVYALLERWRDFGTDKFKSVGFPKSNYYGYRRTKKNKNNGENPPLTNDENSPLENAVSDENSTLKMVLPQELQR